MLATTPYRISDWLTDMCALTPYALRFYVTAPGDQVIVGRVRSGILFTVKDSSYALVSY
jgi:hypothetical protein